MILNITYTPATTYKNATITIRDAFDNIKVYDTEFSIVANAISFCNEFNHKIDSYTRLSTSSCEELFIINPYVVKVES
jgi:hypothetical protein